MSVECVVFGSCSCGNRIHAGAEERGHETDGFYVCPRCSDLSGSQGYVRREADVRCKQCQVPLLRWDERTCPRCGAAPELTFSTVFN